jgi:hypothetical protein
MVLILLNVFLFGLLQIASNEFGRDLLNSVLVSFSRIPEDAHQGSGVTSGDRSPREGGYHPPPKVECLHTHLKPTAKLERDGSASPSIEVRAVAIR